MFWPATIVDEMSDWSSFFCRSAMDLEPLICSASKKLFSPSAMSLYRSYRSDVYSSTGRPVGSFDLARAPPTTFMLLRMNVM